MIAKLMSLVTAVRHGLAFWRELRKNRTVKKEYQKAEDAARKGDVEKLNDMLR